MKDKLQRNVSLSEVHGSVDTTGKRSRWKQLFIFFGPAYLVSVGYMDPGNWATDLAGGSQFGYSLIWVLLMSNGMAILLQNLSARLGIVRGRDLAQANREIYPRYINLALYVLAEIAIAACDLAEVLGMAIGIQLLTGLPLIYGVSITVLDTFLLLFLQRLGMRRMEAFIIGLIAIVGLSFLVEILLARPALSEIASGFIPRLQGKQALYIAIGIIGATVMPHNLYLHSALVQTRKIGPGAEPTRRALKINFLDSSIALNLAFFVNAAILILAAKVFFSSGRTNVASIKDAYQLLPMLGTVWAPKLFAIALIAAGQSSTVTGTLAGQIVMEGYLQLRINPWVRRLLTRLLAIIPAVAVILILGEERVDDLLVFSQVILSIQLGFAVIPLIHFVSDKTTMGKFVIHPVVKALAWTVASLLVYLNVRLVVEEASPFFGTAGSLGWKILIVAGSIGGILLLLYVFFHPWIVRQYQRASIRVHGQPKPELLADWKAPAFRHIAIALDFSKHDEKLLAYAVGQGGKDCRYLLIHVVESASSLMLGKETNDYETRGDQQQLDDYRSALLQKGYESVTRLGFRHRSREIARIVREEKADMLVIGAHGHSGLKDFIYGETVNAVRHELRIPVLIISV
ncbi:MAG: Nramp family divalent metal transporter [Bacteroidota bacterium]|nr:Nramp family divalent metal transporter [Bacteroidota bacterium]MDP4217770.1 Nramp family divalent metal transporter [Bacteroidota bacterium]MDP4247256.1 Nramp family divalent metal transporter [Bacteroidota bacterium]MDP4253818.1 Nramp family divalent metal transporter [Bacteroidota bacterium]MDP4259502.1 Nramp family divalent metal transporter [Bacteroidota bacterium]